MVLALTHIMEDPTHTTQSDQPTESIPRLPLTYAFDGRFLSSTPPDNITSDPTESNQIYETSQSSESKYFQPTRETGHTASLRLLGDSMLRMEQAELEMMKKREIARLEAEKRRSVVEDEMTRMMLQTQLQIASFVSQNRSTRKRKRSNLIDSSNSSERDRDGALIATLLQCNFT